MTVFGMEVMVCNGLPEDTLILIDRKAFALWDRPKIDPMPISRDELMRIVLGKKPDWIKG